jgi:dCTP diphosphatase
MSETSGSDANITISQLQDEVQQFVLERGWSKYQTPKNLSMSIAIEAAEIMEHFQWPSSEQSVDLIRENDMKNQVADELADVLVYCLIFANNAKIDITSAVRSKMGRNQKRFPVGYMPTKEE